MLAGRSSSAAHLSKACLINSGNLTLIIAIGSGARVFRPALDFFTAARELSGVRKAAMAAGRRMSALEEQAEALHAKTLLSCTARIVSTPESGLHALLTDAHAA